MPKDCFRYFGDRRFRFLRRLFRAWHQQLAECEKGLYDDLPYWCGERTNIGVLAAAALRLSGVVALEEFPIRRRERAGRADLWFYDTHTQRSYDFEFKFRYSALKAPAVARIKSAMRDASSDVRSLPTSPAGAQGVAVTFVVPYVSTKPLAKEWNSLWRNFTLSVSEPRRFGASFVAIHRGTDEIVRRAGREVKGFHPGVAAFGKVIAR
jgi:hypothetical protein